MQVLSSFENSMKNFTTADKCDTMVSTDKLREEIVGCILGLFTLWQCKVYLVSLFFVSEVVLGIF